MNPYSINSELSIANTTTGSVLIVQGKQGGVTAVKLDGEQWDDGKKQLVPMKKK